MFNQLSITAGLCRHVLWPHPRVSLIYTTIKTALSARVTALAVVAIKVCQFQIDLGRWNRTTKYPIGVMTEGDVLGMHDRPTNEGHFINDLLCWQRNMLHKWVTGFILLEASLQVSLKIKLSIVQVHNGFLHTRNKTLQIFYRATIIVIIHVKHFSKSAVPADTQTLYTSPQSLLSRLL